MQVERNTIKTLFESGIFEIPKSQRDYDWSPEHIDTLIEDLEYYIKSKKKMFLGSIILKEIEKEDENEDDKFEIFDGQQRLTTLTILAICIRRMTLGLEVNKEDERKKAKIINRNEETYLWRDFESKTIRLKPSDSIIDVYKYIIEEDWDGKFPTKIEKKYVKKQTNKISKVYDEFKKTFKNYSLDQLYEIQEKIDTADVIRITVSSDEEAFYLFETINERGKSLETGDLLKNHIFSTINAEDREDYTSRWEDIKINCDDKLTSMLRHFYYTRNGYIGAKQLYSELKKLNGIFETEEFESKKSTRSNSTQEEIRKVEEAACKNLYLYIYEYSEYHFKIAIEQPVNFDNYLRETINIDCKRDVRDEINESIQALRLFGIKQVYPVIYSFFYALKKFNDKTIPSNLCADAKKFSRNFLITLENLHFINYKIGANRGNLVEKIYADYAKSFFSVENIEDFLSLQKKFYEELEYIKDKKDTFIIKFADLSYQNKAKTKKELRYIFHKINNHEQTKLDKIFDLYDNKHSVDIEHWAPSSGNQAKNDPNYKSIYNGMDDDIRNNIGNLLPLNSNQNQQLSSSIPSEKLKILKKDKNINNYRIVDEFLDEYSSDFDHWGREHIEARAKKMAEHCYNEVWKFPSND